MIDLALLRPETKRISWISFGHTLLWRHNECSGISNHRRLNCLLNLLFRRRSKKTPKPHVTGICKGNSSVTGEFPAQKASNAENVSIWSWWRYYEIPSLPFYKEPSTATIVSEVKCGISPLIPAKFFQDANFTARQYLEICDICFQKLYAEKLKLLESNHLTWRICKIRMFLCLYLHYNVWFCIDVPRQFTFYFSM